jgi:hypothetical protein
MIGTGNASVCLNCHTPTEKGYFAAETIHQQLAGLEQAIARADDVLNRAERSGMEVSAAKLEQAEARDALTRARVSIHSFSSARSGEDIQPGMKVARKTLEAGLKALADRDYRRMGLAVSLVAIVVVLIGLRLYIREMESRKGSGSKA